VVEVEVTIWVEEEVLVVTEHLFLEDQKYLQVVQFQ
jgi:hypothetical protein